MKKYRRYPYRYCIRNVLLILAWIHEKYRRYYWSQYQHCDINNPGQKYRLKRYVLRQLLKCPGSDDAEVTVCNKSFQKMCCSKPFQAWTVATGKASSPMVKWFRDPHICTNFHLAKPLVVDRNWPSHCILKKFSCIILTFMCAFNVRVTDCYIYTDRFGLTTLCLWRCVNVTELYHFNCRSLHFVKISYLTVVRKVSCCWCLPAVLRLPTMTLAEHKHKCTFTFDLRKASKIQQ